MSDASTRRVRQDHLVTLTLPAGWLARPPHLSGDDGGVDVDHALAVVEAHELAVLPIPSDTTRDHVLGEMRLPGTDLDASLLVFDERGRAEGYLILELDDALNTIFCNAYVDPASLPEYPSLINELIDHALEYGRHIAIDRHNSWEIACAAYAEDTSYGDALTRAGFEAVRHFFRMRIDLVENPPAEPAPWPAGVTMETVVTEAQQREVWEVAEASFADHWRAVWRPFDEWLARMTADSEFPDPDLWWLVRVDGTPAAFLVGDRSRAHLGDGYVGEVGVKREFRGRGLARGLLLRHFHASALAGHGGVQLGVDASNPTGALQLYESVGMTMHLHLVARHLTWNSEGTQIPNRP